MPKQMLWVENGDASRLLLGREALPLQGFPAKPFLRPLELAILELQPSGLTLVFLRRVSWPTWQGMLWRSR